SLGIVVGQRRRVVRWKGDDKLTVFAFGLFRVSPVAPAVIQDRVEIKAALLLRPDGENFLAGRENFQLIGRTLRLGRPAGKCTPRGRSGGGPRASRGSARIGSA